MTTSFKTLYTYFGQANYQSFLFGLIFILIAILGIGQDFINSTINGSAFYFSESSLFKIHWLLFVPIFWIISKRANRLRPNNLKNQWLWIILFPTILSLLHLGLAALFVYLLSSLFLDHSYLPMGAFRYYVTEELYLIWLVYLLSFLLIKSGKKSASQKERVESNFGMRFIQVTSKNRNIQLPLAEINFIKSERPYLAIITNGDKYLYHSTLKEMIPQLDQSCFVRIHRSTIVNLSHVVSSQSRANGDYDILLTNGQQIRLSRNYLKDFRMRLNRFTQVSL